MDSMKDISLECSATAQELRISVEGRLTAENTPGVQGKIMTLVEDAKPSQVTVDAAALKYISSSGLRLLLLLKKKCPALQMINVSRDIEETLRLTGFDKLLTVRRALREISVAGCPCIGRGQNGEVYRLNRDTIVKLFAADKITAKAAEEERKRAQAAFLLGVPTAISYETVCVGKRVGLIFELVEAKSLREIILEEPTRLEELIPRCAALAKNIHSLTPAPGSLPAMTEIYHGRLDALADLFTPAELDLLHRMTDSLPPRAAFLHGDFHQGNIMVQGEELLLIDMADAAVGHPFYDIMGTYMLGVRLAKTLPPQMLKEIGGWEAPTVYKAWEIFCGEYFRSTIPPEELDAMLAAYSELRYLTFLKIFNLTEEFRRAEAERVKKTFLPQVDGYIRRFGGWLQKNL
ncbi:MAG: phosphotransferase [Selenomonadaceae bacterium]|nr:phosphotransferase [Selenomonadaceae bacterium]